MEASHPEDSEAAFVAELTAHQMPLQLYVRSLLPGDPASADVAQQINATIWKKRSDYRLGTNFRAWAFAIARFEVLTYRKKQAAERHLQFTDELETVISQEIVDRVDDVQQRHEALQECLKSLKPADRELLMHRYAGTGTLSEFARKVDRSVGGLKVTLHRLRTALLSCIERRLSADEVSA